MRVANFDVSGVPGVTKATVTTYTIGFDVDSSVGSSAAVRAAAYKHLDIEVETPVDAVEEAEEALAVAAGEE